MSISLDQEHVTSISMTSENNASHSLYIEQGHHIECNAPEQSDCGSNQKLWKFQRAVHTYFLPLFNLVKFFYFKKKEGSVVDDPSGVL